MKRYEIYKHIGNLSPLNNGWIKELNLISWDNKEPVYDIRTWNSEHTEYGKGVTITAGQMVVLKNLLNGMSIFRFPPGCFLQLHRQHNSTQELK